MAEQSILERNQRQLYTTMDQLYAGLNHVTHSWQEHFGLQRYAFLNACILVTVSDTFKSM